MPLSKNSTFALPSTHKAVAFSANAPNPLTEIITVPTSPPNDTQVLIKVNSIALNPTDWKHFAAGWGSKGSILGTDSSGIVVSVGSKVTKFKIGDFVGAFTHGGYKQDPNGGSFQEYVAVDENLCLKYENLVESSEVTNYSLPVGQVSTFEGAAAVNLGLATIGMSFFQLKLEPFADSQKNEWILIWGGATATGLLAIQVAKKIYGLNVITTASVKHHALLKKLGADEVVDYRDSDAIDKVKQLTDNNIKYALDSVSSVETYNQTNECLRSTGEAYLDNLLAVPSDALKNKKSNVTLASTLVYAVEGVPVDLNGAKIPVMSAVVDAHRKFYPLINKYVSNGEILHQPLKFLPGGLSGVNDGLELLKKGVSGEKLILRIQDTK